MTATSPAEHVQACLESIVGVRVALPKYRDPVCAAHEPQITLTHGPWFGDVYSGGSADTTVAVKNLVHPTSGRQLTLRLVYAVHDLSGQVDSWALTLEGFPPDESAALRDQLHPGVAAWNLNNHLRYHFCIDGSSGSVHTRKE